jgi:2-haloacid dehalogenase
MQVKAVVFDIGNVLIGWQPEAWYDARIGADRRSTMFAQTGVEAANAAVDAGAPFRDTIYALADQHPDWATEIRWWHDHWIDIASPRIDHSVKLLRALRAKGVSVFALTNFGEDTFVQAQAHYDFLGEFDRSYVSARLRLVKPNDAIYAAVERDCEIPPGALLFADDRAENIEAAAARGWQVHHFQHSAGWAEVLVRAGLLTQAEANP